MVNKSQPVIAIVGSTCTGKTRLSLELGAKLKTEIIACDSRTVYKGMDIGTAKPTAEERATVPHHMLDVIDPLQTFTTAQFKNQATPLVENLIENGFSPIVCGGTGFYFRNLLEGLQIPAVEPQTELRKDLNDFADENGNPALHKRLQELDAVSAERINANDRFRVVRALEVTMYSGKPFSQLTARIEPPFDVVWIGLYCEDREALAKMIRGRIAQQIDQGLMSEVQSLYKQYGRCHSLLHTVGYAEIIQYIDGEISLQESIDLVALHTYQLARKQLLWFRSNKKIIWFAIDQVPFAQIFSRALECIAGDYSKSPGL
jgi:tRNA dimethylallyltransferase